MVLACCLVKGIELLDRETYGHDLHRLGATARTTPAPALELLDVIASLGLIGPLLDLVLTHHPDIV